VPPVTYRVARLLSIEPLVAQNACSGLPLNVFGQGTTENLGDDAEVVRDQIRKRLG